MVYLELYLHFYIEVMCIRISESFIDEREKFRVEGFTKQDKRSIILILLKRKTDYRVELNF